LEARQEYVPRCSAPTLFTLKIDVLSLIRWVKIPLEGEIFSPCAVHPISMGESPSLMVQISCTKVPARMLRSKLKGMIRGGTGGKGRFTVG
jgi:hypothetical protein